MDSTLVVLFVLGVGSGIALGAGLAWLIARGSHKKQSTSPIRAQQDPLLIALRDENRRLSDLILQAQTQIAALEKPKAPPLADDFTQITGIGPVFARRLREQGIRTFAELARLDESRIAEIVKPVSWKPVDLTQWRRDAALLASQAEGQGSPQLTLLTS